jgi:hypothetical protein
VNADCQRDRAARDSAIRRTDRARCVAASRVAGARQLDLPATATRRGPTSLDEDVPDIAGGRPC